MHTTSTCTRTRSMMDPAHRRVERAIIHATVGTTDLARSNQRIVFGANQSGVNLPCVARCIVLHRKGSTHEGEADKQQPKDQSQQPCSVSQAIN